MEWKELQDISGEKSAHVEDNHQNSSLDHGGYKYLEDPQQQRISNEQRKRVDAKSQAPGW